jgi:hypothetical protein
VVSLHIFIQEVLISKHDRALETVTEIIIVLFSFKKMSGQYIKLRHNRFLKNSVQFIVHQTFYFL